MSDFDSNPFADPDLNNPFKDPSVTQVTRNVPPGLDEYNPFSDSRTPPPGNVKMPNVPSTQPAIMKPTEEHPAYTQIAKEHALAQAELLKRQEELERKAAELDRREREMQNLSQHGRKNNWPPLPDNFPVGPCFYQDFSVDIPVEFQKTVKIMYYLWMFHAVTLFLNIFGCLAWFCVDPPRGVDFGLSILWFLLFTPCSFVCWYRPLYGAFRSDSSFRFFVFFFVYICQFAVHVLQAAGFHNWGNCGWISSLTGLNKSIPVGIMMIIIAALFTASAVISLVMFKKGQWTLEKYTVIKKKITTFIFEISRPRPSSTRVDSQICISKLVFSPWYISSCTQDFAAGSLS
ncbi:secretory carrier-associated membrane protein 1 isoform X2 [Sagmatias obliquidens]|uniref:secretory carrier-associated membrane protein 1 isoform X2 n=1 Tax=Sagmatias obliquidens TaxID=3371155 RepID=UPI000F4441DF|nr:secretory carrier-associated membrane protein 1 isoform X2 [Lagenorhynchus obliquidens]XP_030702266.1 secretory carrier-associated membrane protein 1 isoform X2 [Globicephala melas]